jgi:hypothetical protein
MIASPFSELPGQVISKFQTRIDYRPKTFFNISLLVLLIYQANHCSLLDDWLIGGHNLHLVPFPSLKEHPRPPP